MPNMRILSWNCKGAFRKKFHLLDAYNGDIHVIQECEDPKQTKHYKYENWGKNHLWVGETKNRGLAIFAKPNIKLTRVQDHSEDLLHFILCKLTNDITLLAVWTKLTRSSAPSYIGQLYEYLQRNKVQLNTSKTIIIGDWNSNTCWDKKSRNWNHSDVVRELDEIGIASLYHSQSHEAHGQESTPTFFMHGKPEKPYHIDYCFASKTLCENSNLSIEKNLRWLDCSDHVPLIAEFNRFHSVE